MSEPEKSPMQCQNCRHWSRYGKRDQRGECHRYPPRPSLWSEAWWPQTASDDSCGEFCVRTRGALRVDG